MRIPNYKKSVKWDYKILRRSTHHTASLRFPQNPEEERAECSRKIFPCTVARKILGFIGIRAFKIQTNFSVSGFSSLQ